MCRQIGCIKSEDLLPGEHRSQDGDGSTGFEKRESVIFCLVSKETRSRALICLHNPGFGAKFKGLVEFQNLEADWLVLHQSTLLLLLLLRRFSRV